MVRSRDVVPGRGIGADGGSPEGRLESVPTGRRPGRAPWRRGSGGAPAGSATWCCGCCVAHRWRRCPVRRAWRSTGSKRGGERAMAGLELGLKESSRRARGGDARRGEASHRGAVDGDRAAPRAGPGRGAAPPFGDAGGRDDERDDLRGDGALFRHPAGVSGLGALALGALRAAGRGHTTTGWARGRRGGGRCRGNRTRSCWR